MRRPHADPGHWLRHAGVTLTPGEEASTGTFGPATAVLLAHRAPRVPDRADAWPRTLFGRSSSNTSKPDDGMRNRS